MIHQLNRPKPIEIICWRVDQLEDKFKLMKSDMESLKETINSLQQQVKHDEDPVMVNKPTTGLDTPGWFWS